MSVGSEQALSPSLPRIGSEIRPLAIAATALATALLAQVAIPLPFTPVPVTGQTLAVLLSGALLGARGGALAQLSYLGAGALGLPLFAAGSFGALRLLGPTGGYLAAFPLAAWLVGRLAQAGWTRTRRRALVALALGQLAIWGLGLLGLTRWVAPGTLLASGLYPFLAGDLLKLLLAAALLPLTSRR